MPRPYCTRAKVYALGIPPEAFARSPRQVEAVDATTDTIALRAHGLAADFPLSFKSLSSSVLGAPAATIPAPLVAGVTYYAQPTSSDAFQVSATIGGGAINLTTAGVGVVGILRNHEPDLDAAILEAAILLESDAVAYRGPLTADFLEGANARLGAILYVRTHGVGNPQYADNFKGIEEAYDKYYGPTLARLRKGGEMPAGSSDSTPAIVEMGAVSVTLAGRGFLECEDGAV